MLEYVQQQWRSCKGITFLSPPGLISSSDIAYLLESIVKLTFHMITIFSINIFRPDQRTLAIQTRGETRCESQQIAANRGKFHSENNGDHFFKRSRRIASQRAFQKTMAITLEVKFEPFLACTILVHAGQFIFSI